MNIKRCLKVENKFESEPNATASTLKIKLANGKDEIKDSVNLAWVKSLRSSYTEINVGKPSDSWANEGIEENTFFFINRTLDLNRYPILSRREGAHPL